MQAEMRTRTEAVLAGWVTDVLAAASAHCGRCHCASFVRWVNLRNIVFNHFWEGFIMEIKYYVEPTKAHITFVCLKFLENLFSLTFMTNPIDYLNSYPTDKIHF